MLINPSLICFNHINIATTVRVLWNHYECRRIHVDVMDDNRVPRMGIYPEIVKSIEEQFPDIEFDVHLMVDDVLGNIKRWGSIDSVTRAYFHVDHTHPNKTLEAVELCDDMGIRPGIVLDLMDDPALLGKYNFATGRDLDVMLMGILPGVLKQKDHSEILFNNMSQLRLIHYRGEVQIDGSVRFDTIHGLKSLGATSLVCGSSTLFKDVDFNSKPFEWESKVKENIKTMESMQCSM